MINGYSIKNINGEDVLYLYMDYSSEFARIDKRNNTEIKKKIRDYINNNNIKFKGAMVALVVGGVMIGTVTLNRPNNNSDSLNTNKIVAIINQNMSENNTLTTDTNEINDIEIAEEPKDSNIVKSDNKSTKIDDVKKGNTNVNNITSVKEEKIENSSSNLNNNLEINNNLYSNEEKEEVIDNNIYIELYRKNGVVERIELEEYVIGVVGAEMPASFNMEALKAQAVVARTYAVNNINKNKRLTDNNSTQNYKSNNELKNMWGNSYNIYYEKIKNAVYSTKGMYLTYNGEVIDAVYHSTSNGYTEDSIYVWENSKPYLKSVTSIYDNTNKNFLYSMFLTYETISSKLNNIVDMNTEFNVLEKNNSGRIVSIEINGVTYSGVSIRNLLGLRSTDFDIEKNETGINFITRGYGHGVGMSQYGANGMANNGSDFKNILFHYYTGVSINSL